MSDSFFGNSLSSVASTLELSFPKRSTETLSKMGQTTNLSDLREAATQFESLMLGEMFKVMRNSVPDSGLMGGSSFGRDTFTAMLDEEFAKIAATRGSMGMADMLVQQMAPSVMASAVPRHALSDVPLEVQNRLNDGGWIHPLRSAEVPLRSASVPLRSASVPLRSASVPQINTLSEGQRFGAIRLGQRPEECGGGHCGVDLARSVGTPIYAPQDAVVAAINEDTEGAGGRTVTLSHGEGLRTRYMHLDTISGGLVVGQSLSQGKEIGTVGNTGSHSRGDHLHFEIEYGQNGVVKKINPELFLEKWR